jgi:pentatricopeptide repeat protein
LHRLAQEGKFKEASSLLFSMRAKGIPPSSTTLSTLLNAYMKRGRAREGQEFFHSCFPPSAPPSAPPSFPSSSPTLDIALDLKLQTTYLSLLLALRRPLPEVSAFVQTVEEREGGRKGWREEGKRVYTLWVKACLAGREWKTAVGSIKVGRKGGREGGREREGKMAGSSGYFFPACS